MLERLCCSVPEKSAMDPQVDSLACLCCCAVHHIRPVLHHIPVQPYGDGTVSLSFHPTRRSPTQEGRVPNRERPRTAFSTLPQGPTNTGTRPGSTSPERSLIRAGQDGARQAEPRFLWIPYNCDLYGPSTTLPSPCLFEPASLFILLGAARRTTWAARVEERINGNAGTRNTLFTGRLKGTDPKGTWSET